MTETEEAPKGLTRSRIALLSLITLFMAPLVGTYILVYGFEPDKLLGTANNGHLIIPIRPVAASGLPETAEQGLAQDFFGKKWSWVHIAETCDDVCEKNLYHTRQLHIGLNKDIERIQRLFIYGKGVGEEQLARLKEEHPLTRFEPVPDSLKLQDFFGIKEAKADSANYIYLVDPQRYLMMYHTKEHTPKEIYKDIKKLLKISQVG